MLRTGNSQPEGELSRRWERHTIALTAPFFQSLLGLLADTRGAKNEASPQTKPHHRYLLRASGDNASLCTGDQRKSAGTGGWGPLQLALSLDNKQYPYRAMSGGWRRGAPCSSAMLGITLITNSFLSSLSSPPTHSINLTNLLLLPFKSVSSRVPASLGMEKVGHRPDVVFSPQAFPVTLLRLGT